MFPTRKCIRRPSRSFTWKVNQTYNTVMNGEHAISCCGGTSFNGRMYVLRHGSCVDRCLLQHVTVWLARALSKNPQIWVMNTNREKIRYAIWVPIRTVQWGRAEGWAAEKWKVSGNFGTFRSTFPFRWWILICLPSALLHHQSQCPTGNPPFDLFMAGLWSRNLAGEDRRFGLASLQHASFLAPCQRRLARVYVAVIYVK